MKKVETEESTQTRVRENKFVIEIYYWFNTVLVRNPDIAYYQ